MPGRWRGREASMFAETVGLDDSFLFFPGKNPDLGAGLAGGAVPTRRTLTVPRALAICEPLNIHSPPGPCYMCYMCYMGLTRQATEHPLFPGPCYICNLCVLQGKPLNIDSPRVPVLYVLYGPI